MASATSPTAPGESEAVSPLQANRAPLGRADLIDERYGEAAGARNDDGEVMHRPLSITAAPGEPI